MGNAYLISEKSMVMMILKPQQFSIQVTFMKEQRYCIYHITTHSADDTVVMSNALSSQFINKNMDD